jgi:hypothetical protein
MNRKIVLLPLLGVGLMASRCDDDGASIEVKWNLRGAAPEPGCAAENAGRVEVDFGSSHTQQYFSGEAACKDGGLVFKARVKDVTYPTLRYTARLYSADSSRKEPLTVASSEVAPLVNGEGQGASSEFNMLVFVDFFVDGVVPGDGGEADAGAPEDAGVEVHLCDAGAGEPDAGEADAGEPDAGACGMPFEPCCPGSVCAVGIQCSVATGTCG